MFQSNNNQQRSPKIFYLRVPNKNKQEIKNDKLVHRGDPFGCVASRIESSLDDQGNMVQMLVYSISVASQRDQFDKQLARKIATERLNTGAKFMVTSNINCDLNLKNIDALALILEHVASNKTVNEKDSHSKVISGSAWEETFFCYGPRYIVPERARKVAKRWLKAHEEFVKSKVGQ